MGRIKQELEGMGMRDIWKHASNNNNNIWVRITERYAYTIERKNIEVMMREKISLTFSSISRSI
jgi:hypothetical protein